MVRSGDESPSERFKICGASETSRPFAAADIMRQGNLRRYQRRLVRRVQLLDPALLQNGGDMPAGSICCEIADRPLAGRPTPPRINRPR